MEITMITNWNGTLLIARDELADYEVQVSLKPLEGDEKLDEDNLVAAAGEAVRKLLKRQRVMS